MVAGGAIQKYGTELEQHQQLLNAASNILIESIHGRICNFKN